MNIRRGLKSLALAKAVALVVGIAAVFAGAVAFAQAATPLPPLDLTPYLRDAGGIGLAVMGIVAFIKARTGLAGNSVVFLSLATGGVLGLISGLLGLAAGGPLGGLLLGITGALTGSATWDAATGIATKAGEANANAQIKAALILDATKGSASANASTVAAPLLKIDPETLTDYLLQLVRDRFGRNVPDFVWAMLATLTREFAGKTLNTEVRAAIQRRLLDLLAAAGAEGVDL